MKTDTLEMLDEIRESWSGMTPEERVKAFRSLMRNHREDLFEDLAPSDQSELLMTMPEHERRTYIRVLAPDDVADLIQAAPDQDRHRLLDLLDATVRREVNALLAYAEDDAGGLMSPRFARLRPEMTVAEAVSYLRLQGRQLETLYYAYVLDADQRLLGTVSLRDLFTAAADRKVADLMEQDVVAVAEDTDQEEVARLFADHDLMAIPVLDPEGRMKGIVTVDDAVDVVLEEDSEDIQKMGGMEALDDPYMNTSFWRLVRKRAGWLSLLFVGELLTASAMQRYEIEIARAVVLAIFIPLIISSGGNSGSQASTLVIRAMALGEVRLRDWWKVMRRELMSGLVLGTALAVLGLLRVVLGEHLGGAFGEHYLLIAGTVSFSLVGVVMFGTVSGSMLPFLLRRAGVDPASASGPFVATLVDVTGLVIYFSLAAIFLKGTLL